MVQLFSVQGPGHKHFTDGVIGGDDLKGPSDVARGQRENHLSGRREVRGDEEGHSFLLGEGVAWRVYGKPLLRELTRES